MRLFINNQNQVKNLDNKLTLISYLISNGITIPHYCYHNDLSVAGNCRVCLIELKNSPKPVVSCGISAKSCLLNNKVYYDSVLLKKARENILEFLLLNHPVDCPICDQGGECDLQEQSLFFGFTKKRFYKFKRVVSDKDLGPVVKTVMTRCIHCTRCVRFATEVAGVEDLGVFSRGVGSEIGTYVDKIFLSELSGNVVDLCPVGALTLKSFPFALRRWDVATYNSIDITDSFGQDTRVYVNKNQIIKIEPQFSNTSSYTWLTDKGRQFFDSMFSDTVGKSASLKSFPAKTTKQWRILFKTVTENFYIFNICNFKTTNKHYFIILFENVSLEILNLLFLVSQIHPFIKIKRAENLKINTNLESNFQIDSATEKSKLSFSSLCLLIGTNTRYEGSYLNLKLRQRYFKGNFKLISVGSLIDLTFPISFLGSQISHLKTLTEGNHIFCKEIINSKNPILLTNTETLKRNDVQKLLSIVKTFKYTNILSKIWDGCNVLNSSLYETGFHLLTSFSFLTFKDLLSFNSLYMINTNLNNVSNLKKITESKLIFHKSPRKMFDKNLLISQSFDSPSVPNSFLKFKKYVYLPNNIFFENQETFINTEGFIKRTTKLIYRKKTKNDWKLLRKFIKSFRFKNNIIDKNLISCNTKDISSFKIFINFQYYATQTLTNLNFYLGTKNQKFSIYKKFNVFKRRPIKFFNTQLSYWLNDFYTGGKDTFCQNSLLLVRCSTNNKLQLTNFFSIMCEFDLPDLQNVTVFLPTQLNSFESIIMVSIIGYVFFMRAALSTKAWTAFRNCSTAPCCLAPHNLNCRYLTEQSKKTKRYVCNDGFFARGVVRNNTSD